MFCQGFSVVLGLYTLFLTNSSSVAVVPLLLLDDIVVSSVLLSLNPFALCLSLSTILLLLWFLSLLVCPFRSGSLGVILVAARTREHSLARRIFSESNSCGNILGFSLAFLSFLCISVICLRPPALVHTCVRFAKSLQRLLHFCCFGSFSFEAFVVSCSAGSLSLSLSPQIGL